VNKKYRTIITELTTNVYQKTVSRNRYLYTGTSGRFNRKKLGSKTMNWREHAVNMRNDAHDTPQSNFVADINMMQMSM
jgi:hypothetical protein